MRKIILVTALALIGGFAAEAWAAPVTLPTTRNSVEKECGAKSSGCFMPCGGASCSYNCPDPKTNDCQVTVLKKQVKQNRPPPAKAAAPASGNP
jgi:hypothetical protein